MNADEIAAKLNERFDKLQAEIKGKLSAESLDAITQDVETLKGVKHISEDDMEALEAKFNDLIEKQKDVIDEQGRKLKDLEVNPGTTEAPLVQIRKGLEGVKDTLTKLRKGKNVAFDFEIKAAAVMTTSNVSANTVNWTEAVPGLFGVARNTPLVFSIADVQATNSRVIEWADEANADGTIAITAEGNAKPLIDFDITISTATLEKVAGRITVSTEMLEDLDYIAGEINSKLAERLALAVDGELITATNASWSGLTDYASAYSVSGLDDSIDNAQQIDAIVAAATQVRLANHMPNALVVNPVDAAKIKLLKTTDNGYVSFRLMDGTSIDGVRVIESNQITAGNLLIGDFTKFHVKVKGGVNIRAGYDNDDWSKNMVTIIAEQRLVPYMATNDTTALVYSAFATIQAALETP